MWRRGIIVVVIGLTACSQTLGPTSAVSPSAKPSSSAVPTATASAPASATSSSSPVPSPIASAGVPAASPAVASSAPSGVDLASDSYPSAPSSVQFAALGNGVYGNALLVGGPDTWYWDGSAWHHSNTQFPSYGATAPVFFPSLGKSVVLAGGQTGDAVTTWAWNGMGWSGIIGNIPGETGSSLLGLDAARKQLVALVGSTWVSDGNGWQHAGGAESPPARLAAGIAFDPGSQQLIVFGGIANQSRAPLADTWTWDGKAWTQRHPTTSPPGGWTSLAYDPDTNQLILMNEHVSGDPQHPDEFSMWAWNGGDWQKLSPQRMPALGYMPRLAYDTADHQLLLYEATFGSLAGGSQTWSYANGTWTRVG
jgi:hypothetical protein